MLTTVLVVLLTLYVLNGLFVYRHLVKKAHAEAKPRPSIFAHFVPLNRFAQPIRVQRPVRVVLAFAVFSASATLALMAALSVHLLPTLPTEKWLTSVLFSVVSALFSLGIFYTGLRLVRMRTPDERMFGPTATKVASIAIPLLLLVLAILVLVSSFK